MPAKTFPNCLRSSAWSANCRRVLLLLPEVPRVACRLDDPSYCATHASPACRGGCGWIRTTVLFETWFTARRNRPLCHTPKFVAKKQGPESFWEHPGLVCLIRSESGVIRLQSGCCVPADSNPRAGIQKSLKLGRPVTYRARTTARTRAWRMPVACLFCPL